MLDAFSVTQAFTTSTEAYPTPTECQALCWALGLHWWSKQSEGLAAQGAHSPMWGMREIKK